MISFFLEIVPDDLKERLSEADQYHIVALTPKACFELDKLGYGYSIPDDYLVPMEVTMKCLQKITTELLSFTAFTIIMANSLRPRVYWKSFLSIYVTQTGSKRIEFIAEDNYTCRWLMEELKKFEGIYKE